MLTVIDGTPPKKRRFTVDELAEKHLQMASPAIIGYSGSGDRWELMKGCFNLVRYAIYRNKMLMETKAHKELWVQLAKVMYGIKGFLGRLTPRELITTFPPRKSYEEWDSGYFYTLDLFNGYDWDCPIDRQTADVSLILAGYQNMNIALFNNACFYANDFASNGNKFKQLLSYLDSQGVEYHLSHKDDQGKEYVVDKDGRTSPLKKAKPRHLRLLK